MILSTNLQVPLGQGHSPFSKLFVTNHFTVSNLTKITNGMTMYFELKLKSYFKKSHHEMVL